MFAVLPFFAATQHGTFDAGVVKGKEGVGRSWDVTLRWFDQWQQNGGDIDGGLGWGHVSDGSAAKGNWTFGVDVIEGREGGCQGKGRGWTE